MNMMDKTFIYLESGNCIVVGIGVVFFMSFTAFGFSCLLSFTCFIFTRSFCSLTDRFCNKLLMTYFTCCFQGGKFFCSDFLSFLCFLLPSLVQLLEYQLILYTVNMTNASIVTHGICTNRMMQ